MSERIRGAHERNYALVPCFLLAGSPIRLVIDSRSEAGKLLYHGPLRQLFPTGPLGDASSQSRQSVSRFEMATSRVGKHRLPLSIVCTTRRWA